MEVKMKKLVFAILYFTLLTSCSAQDNNQLSNAADSSANKPQTKIIVNKEYDEQGNLIKFDSTYSYFYSNIEQDSSFADSTYSIFQSDFFNRFPNVQKPFLNDLFFDDSLLTYDFYKDDFFSNRFKLNRKRFDKLFEGMDSLKNEFYKNYSKPNQ
jgi:hypothetical protein